MTLSPEAIKKISEIKLTSMDSIFENKMLGIIYGNVDIYGNADVLEYYNFETEERRKLADANAAIWGVHHDSKNKKTFYDDGDKSLVCLETGLKQERSDYIRSINSFNGLILDAGWYGLFNTETGKGLISRNSLENKNIYSINSFGCFNNSLYALVTKNDTFRSVVEVNTSDPNNFFIGETIKNYDVKHSDICDFAIVPQGKLTGDNGKAYPFSIITCANRYYLDLNGEKIIETKVKNSSNQSINRLKLIKSTPTTAEIIYSGTNLKNIYKANINLTNKTTITEPIITDLSTFVLALQPIFKRDSHEYLSSLGSVIR